METEYHPLPNRSEVTLGNWIITLIVTMIPLLNIIMLFVWSFNRRTNIVKSRWAQATLILLAVWIVLGMIFGGYFMRWLHQGYPAVY